MAAFGVLRVCQRLPGFAGSKLAWKAGGGGDYAVLWAPGVVTPDALAHALVEDVKEASGREELNSSEQIKTQTPEEFRTHAKAALDAGAWVGGYFGESGRTGLVGMRRSMPHHST
jgi:hypothetical protein